MSVNKSQSGQDMVDSQIIARTRYHNRGRHHSSGVVEAKKKAFPTRHLLRARTHAPGRRQSLLQVCTRRLTLLPSLRARSKMQPQTGEAPNDRI